MAERFLISWVVENGHPHYKAYGDGKTEGRMEGEARGKADDILEILSDIGYVPDERKETICQEKDLKKLTAWVKLSARAGSIEKFTVNMAGCD